MARAVTAKDTLLAIKVISLHPDLTDSDIRVGVTLIEHYNRTTGQCDPSIDRLAKLLGLSRRTVIRSIGRLHDQSLIHVVRHGGGSTRNSYEPNWERLKSLGQEWQERFREAARGRMTSENRQAGHSSPKTGDRPVSQTDSINLLNQTYASRHGRTRPGPTVVPSSATAARAAAERRLGTALLKFCGVPRTYARAIELIDDETQELAVATELRRRGTGFNVLKQHLGGRHLPETAVNETRGPSSALDVAGDSTPAESPVRLPETKVDSG